LERFNLNLHLIKIMDIKNGDKKSDFEQISEMLDKID
jgi:hypothetical protein